MAKSKTKFPAGKSAIKLSRRMSPPGPAIAGFVSSTQSYHNLTAAELLECALARGEGHVSENGALVVLTGHHTGRSASDKFVVRDAAQLKHFRPTYTIIALPGFKAKPAVHGTVSETVIAVNFIKKIVLTSSL